VLAVIGTLLGVALGLGGTWLLESRRERSAWTARREERRITALYSLQEEVHPLVRRLGELATHAMEMPWRDEEEYSHAQARERSADRARACQVESARLADPELERRLQKLYRLGPEFDRPPDRGLSDDERADEYTSMLKRLREAENAVFERIRELLAEVETQPLRRRRLGRG
jgi:hypothetical protein